MAPTADEPTARTPTAIPSGRRIALVGPTHPFKGGIAQHTTELATRLAAAGHDVVLESWSEQYPARLYPGEQRVTEPEVPPFPRTRHTLSWRRPDSWVRLGWRLRRGDTAVDVVVVVHVTPIQAPAYLALLWALRGRVRTVVLAHNVLPHEARIVDRPLVRRLLTRANGVLVHSTGEAARVTEVLASGRPARIRPEVETADLPPHLPGGTPTVLPPVDRPPTHRVLFFGLVRPYKGLDVLLEALASGPAALRLVVAGEFWDDVGTHRAVARRLGVADRVEFRPGYVPAAEVAALFASVDAVVMPYRTATASQNVQLAAAHGLPVVVTDTGTLAQGVADGVDGFVVPPGDAAALAGALDCLYVPGTLGALRVAVRRRTDTSGLAWSRYLGALGALMTADRA